MREPPAPGVLRWTRQRKVDVVKAIEGGRLERAIALKAYNLSEEELASWERLAEIYRALK